MINKVFSSSSHHGKARKSLDRSFSFKSAATEPMSDDTLKSESDGWYEEAYFHQERETVVICSTLYTAFRIAKKNDVDARKEI